MFETKITIKTILYYSAKSIALLLVVIRILSDDYKHYGIALIISLIAIIGFCFSLKKFRITEKELIIRKPLWPFKDESYLFDKLLKVRFEFNTSRILGGPKLKVFENDSTKVYSFFYSGDTLNKFINQLERLNIDIEKDEYFLKQLK